MAAVVKQAWDEQEWDTELGFVRERVPAGMRRIKEECGRSQRL
ncbi:hypothetical protein [Streptomyces sp. NPDC004284]